MPRSGIPVICSRATLSCDSSYLQSEKFKAHQREERQKNEDRVKEAIEEMKEKQQVL